MIKLPKSTRPSVVEPLTLGNSATAHVFGETSAVAKIAVVATHGMGQQVPFETIDAITRGIIGAAPNGANAPVQVRTVKLGEQTLQRAEFEVENARGEQVEVHVYEGYWAPLTEDQVTLRDVLRFLAYGSFNGIVNCWGEFWRYLFGVYHDFGSQGLRNRGWLLAAFSAVVSVLVMTTLAIVVTGHAVLQENGIAGSGSWPPPQLLTLYTEAALIFTGCSILFLLPLGFLLWCRKTIKRPSRYWFWRLCCGIANGMLRIWIIVAAICASAVVVFGMWQFICPATLPGPWHQWSRWAVILGWGLLYVVAFVVRGFLIQYIGDVAAYVQSHVLDRFLAIRLQIKKWVMDVASAVYHATNAAGNYEYQGVVMLGHSLGSVIAYDTLNALINQDRLAHGTGDIAARTRALITFGSPLDKTAFVFGHQKKSTSEIREALAASVQPLIQDAGFRQFDWINVFSDRDVISNKLEYYDLPTAANATGARPVHNVVDSDALIPLVAHTEYWSNPTVFDVLFSQL